ncbi:MAG: hypothetical protein IPK17_00190 [Chloroflexi bacterium]|nr:hypothetical protein [Chloroflexota bacterium]
MRWQLPCSPSLLIADGAELTTALDVTTQNQILNPLVKPGDETRARPLC